ncbi:MAG: DsbE family thiol:disulfide interchange protein [Alphaproteobacteria bacterium]|nr:MAG: DsbE family thiol:disulfide interchange protein [Alphaproteobacteria bacterium]
MSDRILPLAVFLAIAALAWWGLSRDNPDELPSMYVARPAPALSLTGLRPGEAPPTAEDLKAPGVKLVNFWASWCGPCRFEHPVMMALKAEGITVIGVNYKDDPAKALGFLAELGDPYKMIGADREGRNGIEWGIYGVPETFVIDGEGKVLLRYPGPMTQEIFDAKIRPLLGR